MDDISPANPYLGPRPFERSGTDRARFFGRDREIQEIVSLIFGHPIVLVYAQSGAGKTSIFNAGITVNLEENGFEILPLTRVRGLAPRNADNAIDNVFSLNALQALEPDAGPASLAGLTLAEYLAQRPRAVRSSRRTAPRVLVFDQFEELFTSFPERQYEQQVAFFQQVVGALNSDPLLRVVFAIREDYLAQLDPFADLLPEGLRIRFRLECLRAEAALLAVTGPLANTPRRFAPGVAASLVKELLRVRTVDAQGNVLEVEGQYAEPVQLQVVCMRLWAGLPPETTLIDQAHLQELGNVDEALAQFYEESIRTVVSATRVSEGELRTWFEQYLITPNGMRSTIYRGAERTGELPNSAVDLLQNLHLIRGEWRAGSHWYELTHDRFVKPIQNANEAWLGGRREAEQARRRLELRANEWVRLGRGRGGLLDEVELREAERWLAILGEADLRYSSDVVQLVESSRVAVEAETRTAEAARQRELAQARALAEAEHRRAEEQAKAVRNLRRLSAVMALVILATLGTAWFAWAQWQTARNSAAEALAAQTRAESAEELAQKAQEHSETRAEAAMVAETLAQNARDRAREQLRQANALRLSAAAINNLETNPELSLLLALQAVGSTMPGLLSSQPATEAEDALRQAVQSSRVRLSLTAHSDEVNAVAYSGDGLWLATAADDKTARVWDAVTGEELRVFEQDEPLYEVDFSQDGARLVTLDGNGGVTLWDVKNGQQRRLAAAAAAVAFRPDGKSVATAEFDGTLRLWNADSGERIDSWLSKTEQIQSLAFSPDGKLLAAVNYGGFARVWDVASHEMRLNVQGSNQWLGAVAFDATGARLATGGGDMIIKIWDLATQQELQWLPSHTNSVTDLAFSPTDDQLISASYDNSAKVWDLTTGQPIFTLAGHTGALFGVAFSPDGATVATAGQDNTVKIWDVTPDQVGLTLAGHIDWVNDAVFSPDGSRVASASDDFTAKVWDAATGAVLLTLTGHTDYVNSVAFSPDGKLLATGSADRSVRVWHAETGQQQLTLAGHSGAIRRVAFSPDGKQLASAGINGQVKIWTVATGVELRTLAAASDSSSGAIYDMAFSSAGDYLATAGKDGANSGAVRVWNPATGDQVAEFADADIWFMAVAFSPDGQQLAAARRDNTVQFCELATRQCTVTLAGHKGAVMDLAFSRQQPRIATASDDGTVRVWDVTTGKQLFSLAHYADPPTAVAYSPDGSRLAVAGQDSQMHIYALQFGDLVAQARRRLTRNITQQECDSYLEPLLPGSCAIAVPSINSFMRQAQGDTPLPAALDLELEAQQAAVDVQLSKAWKYAYSGDTVAAGLSLEAAQKLAEELAEHQPAGKAFDLAGEKRRIAAALSVKGWRLSEQDSAGRGIELIQSAIALDAENGWLHYILGRAYINAKDYPPAVEALQQAVELDPTNSLNYAYLGEAYRLAGSYDEAIEHLQRTIDISPTDAWSIATLGQTYRQIGEYDAAVMHLQKALDLGLQEAWVYYELGTAYQRDRQFNMAVATFENMLTSSSADNAPHYYLGQVYQNTSISKALDAFQRSIKIEPTAWAYAALGATYRMMGEEEQAIDALKRAIEQDASYIDAYIELAEVYGQTKEYAQALDWLQRASDLDSNNVLILFTWGEVYSAMNRAVDAEEKNDAALELLNQQIEQNPEDIQLQRLRAAFYYDYLFDYDEAYAEYASILEANPDNLDDQLNSAEGSLGAGHFDAAYKLAEAILTEDKTVQKLLESEKWTMQAIRITALILQGEDEPASQQIDQLLVQYEDLSSDTPMLWSFAGTRHFVEEAKERSQLESTAASMLLALFDLLEAPPEPDELRNFEEQLAEWRSATLNSN